MLVLIVGAVLAAGAFVIGRVTAPHAVSGYAAGVAAGRAQGVQEGRALQEGLALPADTRDATTAAFNAGYRAGANDVFGGYDGGWSLGARYLITLAAGSDGITYRIASRTPA
jgi:hypothetical protein